MSGPIRVLHVFGALNPGGVETFVMNLYRNVDTEKIQFDFALTQGVKSFFDDEVLERGGRIFYFDQSRSLWSNLSGILRERGPFAAVHSHVYFYSGAVLLNARLHGVPVRLAHAHNAFSGQTYTFRRRCYEALARRLILWNATGMFGCSETACRYVFGKDCMGDRRCRVIHNGFPVEDYAFDQAGRDRVRAQYRLEGRFVVGHVGWLEHSKNHAQLVEQFAAIRAKRKDAALLLVGRGSLMESILRKCEDLGIADSVVFAGAQKDTPAYYSAMDVFLFPSLYEGLGTVLVEAQANGLPCVTSADVVPEEVNVTGNVTFVPLEAPAETWADVALGLPERSRDRTWNAKVAESYGAGKIAAELSRIYLQRG